jgi:hypothetical protein
MAVHQATRSKSLAQPQPQHAKTGRTAIPDRAKTARSGNPGAGDPAPRPQRAKNARAAVAYRTTAAQSGSSEPQPTDHQRKAELFKTLERLNRGYGVALAALDRLRNKDRRRVFPAACLNDFRNRTEMLRALANRDLLRLLAGHEEQEAERLEPTHR